MSLNLRARLVAQKYASATRVPNRGKSAVKFRTDTADYDVRERIRPAAVGPIEPAPLPLQVISPRLSDQDVQKIQAEIDIAVADLRVAQGRVLTEESNLTGLKTQIEYFSGTPGGIADLFAKEFEAFLDDWFSLMTDYYQYVLAELRGHLAEGETWDEAAMADRIGRFNPYTERGENNRQARERLVRMASVYDYALTDVQPKLRRVASNIDDARSALRNITELDTQLDISEALDIIEADFDRDVRAQIATVVNTIERALREGLEFTPGDKEFLDEKLTTAGRFAEERYADQVAVQEADINAELEAQRARVTLGRGGTTAAQEAAERARRAARERQAARDRAEQQAEQQAERERAERERAERERAERERAERERAERERAERERVEQQAERERAERQAELEQQAERERAEQQAELEASQRRQRERQARRARGVTAPVSQIASMVTAREEVLASQDIATAWRAARSLFPGDDLYDKLESALTGYNLDAYVSDRAVDVDMSVYLSSWSYLQKIIGAALVAKRYWIEEGEQEARSDDPRVRADPGRALDYIVNSAIAALEQLVANYLLSFPNFAAIVTARVRTDDLVQRQNIDAFSGLELQDVKPDEMGYRPGAKKQLPEWWRLDPGYTERDAISDGDDLIEFAVNGTGRFATTPDAIKALGVFDNGPDFVVCMWLSAQPMPWLFNVLFGRLIPALYRMRAYRPNSDENRAIKNQRLRQIQYLLWHVEKAALRTRETHGVIPEAGNVTDLPAGATLADFYYAEPVSDVVQPAAVYRVIAGIARAYRTDFNSGNATRMVYNINAAIRDVVPSIERAPDTTGDDTDLVLYAEQILGRIKARDASSGWRSRVAGGDATFVAPGADPDRLFLNQFVGRWHKPETVQNAERVFYDVFDDVDVIVAGDDDDLRAEGLSFLDRHKALDKWAMDIVLGDEAAYGPPTSSQRMLVEATMPYLLRELMSHAPDLTESASDQGVDLYDAEPMGEMRPPTSGKTSASVFVERMLVRRAKALLDDISGRAGRPVRVLTDELIGITTVPDDEDEATLITQSFAAIAGRGLYMSPPSPSPQAQQEDPTGVMDLTAVMDPSELEAAVVERVPISPESLFGEDFVLVGPAGSTPVPRRQFAVSPQYDPEPLAIGETTIPLASPIRSPTPPLVSTPPTAEPTGVATPPSFELDPGEEGLFGTSPFQPSSTDPSSPATETSVEQLLQDVSATETSVEELLQDVSATETSVEELAGLSSTETSVEQVSQPGMSSTETSVEEEQPAVVVAPGIGGVEPSTVGMNYATQDPGGKVVTDNVFKGEPILAAKAYDRFATEIIDVPVRINNVQVPNSIGVLRAMEQLHPSQEFENELLDAFALKTVNRYVATRDKVHYITVAEMQAGGLAQWRIDSKWKPTSRQTVMMPIYVGDASGGHYSLLVFGYGTADKPMKASGDELGYAYHIDTATSAERRANQHAALRRMFRDPNSKLHSVLKRMTRSASDKQLPEPAALHLELDDCDFRRWSCGPMMVALVDRFAKDSSLRDIRDGGEVRLKWLKGEYQWTSAEAKNFNINKQNGRIRTGIARFFAGKYAVDMSEARERGDEDMLAQAQRAAGLWTIATLNIARDFGIVGPEGTVEDLDSSNIEIYVVPRQAAAPRRAPSPPPSAVTVADAPSSPTVTVVDVPAAVVAPPPAVTVVDVPPPAVVEAQPSAAVASTEDDLSWTDGIGPINVSNTAETSVYVPGVRVSWPPLDPEQAGKPRGAEPYTLSELMGLGENMRAKYDPVLTPEGRADQAKVTEWARGAIKSAIENSPTETPTIAMLYQPSDRPLRDPWRKVVIALVQAAQQARAANEAHTVKIVVVFIKLGKEVGVAANTINGWFDADDSGVGQNAKDHFAAHGESMRFGFTGATAGKYVLHTDVGDYQKRARELGL